MFAEVSRAPRVGKLGEERGLVAAEWHTAVIALLQSIAFAPAFTYDAVQRSLHSDILLFVLCFRQSQMW